MSFALWFHSVTQKHSVYGVTSVHGLFSRLPPNALGPGCQRKGQTDCGCRHSSSLSLQEVSPSQALFLCVCDSVAVVFLLPLTGQLRLSKTDHLMKLELTPT